MFRWRHKRWIMLVTLLLASILVITACSSGGGGNQAAAANNGSSSAGGNSGGSSTGTSGGSSSTNNGNNNSGGSSNSSTSGQASQSHTLVIGTTDSATTMDPANAYDNMSSQVLYNVAQTLLAYKPGTDKLQPLLATKWNVSSDGLTYTFELRKGVKFQDGTKMDAKAVKFSLDRARKLGGDPAFLLDNIKNVKVTGNYEVQITLKHKSSAFLSKLAYTVASIVSPKSTPKGKFQPKKVVGTGPYKLVQWKQGARIVVKSWDGYWGKKPPASKVVVKHYQKSSGLQLAVQNKEVDVAYRDFTPLERKALKANKQLKIWDVGSPKIRYIVFNTQKKPTKSVHLRRAVAYAIDRSKLNKSVYQGTVKPLYSMIPASMWGYKPVFKTRYGTGANLAKARQELKQAGYDSSNPLKIDLWYTPTHYGDAESNLAQVLKQQIEATGAVKVTLKTSEWGRYVKDMQNGNMNMFLLGWFPDYFDPDDYTTPFLSKNGAASLGSFYNNAKMNQLLTKEVGMTSKAKRTKVFSSIQDLLARDIPDLPLYQGRQFAAGQPGVQGVKLGPVQIFRYYLISKKSWQ